jgi:DNA-binding NtrC family response regulator
VFASAKALKAKTTRAADRQSLQSSIAFNARQPQAVQLGSFRDEKNSLVSNFERTYITQALIKHSGNIAMAARASNKHRRAFWALMRKHDIAAEPYRAEEDQE